MEHTRDPDELYDDAPIARLEIVCRRNGALSVAGDISNLAYALAMLDNARDAVRNHHSRRPVVVPGKDTTLNAGRIREPTEDEMRWAKETAARLGLP